MNRNTWAAIAATLAVIAVVGLGFRFLGGPRRQRLLRADEAKVRALAQFAQNICQSSQGSHSLPANVDKFSEGLKKDAVTGESFVYHRKSDTEYELCTTFGADNHDQDTSNAADWLHPKGEYCFQFDTTRPIPNPPYDY